MEESRWTIAAGPTKSGRIVALAYGPVAELLALTQGHSNPSRQNFNRRFVFSQERDDDVSVMTTWLDVGLVHRTDSGFVLVTDFGMGSTTFLDVPTETSNKSDVSRSIHKDPQINVFPDFGNRQEQNPFHDQYSGGFDRYRVVGACMGCEVINRSFDGFPCGKRTEVLHEELIVEGVGMIPVIGTSDGFGHVVPSVVIGIVVEHGHFLRAES